MHSPPPDSTAIGPRRIVALTEETTEWLYLLGEQDRLVGVSGYTVRPAHARHEKPRISSFLDGRIDRIVALEPDLVIGFSDMQAALADKLIRAGLSVWITNQRSVGEIERTLLDLAQLIGRRSTALELVEGWRAERAQWQRTAAAWPRRPRVYFEEWDEPMISAIGWVSELVGLAGGEDVFAELGRCSLGRDRIIHDPLEPARREPDLIIGSWCGKKFRPERVAARPGWAAIPAVRLGQLHEIKSCDILQPGPAALTDGGRRLHSLMNAWAQTL